MSLTVDCTLLNCIVPDKLSSQLMFPIDSYKNSINNQLQCIPLSSMSEMSEYQNQMEQIRLHRFCGWTFGARSFICCRFTHWQSFRSRNSTHLWTAAWLKSGNLPQSGRKGHICISEWMICGWKQLTVWLLHCGSAQKNWRICI